MIIKTLLKIFLLAPVLVFGQTIIYRSAGTTAAISTGTGNNLTISGTTATFASALPDTIGVGDCIQYDDDDDGDIDANDSVCFIHGRTSSTVFTVANAAGGTPTATAAPDQNWSVFRAYTALASWETGTENIGIDADVRNFDTYSGSKDITSATGSNERWNVAVYNYQDTGLPAMNWTTASANYARIYAPYLITEVGTRQRHQGIYSTSFARIAGTTAIISTTSGTNHLRLEGLQVWQNGSGASGSHAIDFDGFAAGYDFRIEGCILRGGNGIASTVHSGVQIFTNSSTAGTVKISNCIIYDFNSSNTVSVAATSMRAAGGTMYVHNVTAFNCKQGYQRTNGTLNVNNSSMNTHGIATGDGFVGTVGGNYNISNLASDAPGANSKNSTVIAYVDSTAGSFLLKTTDTAAKNSGTDLSGDANLAVTDDILKTARPQGAAFDIGAHEVEVSSVSRNRVIIIGSVERFMTLFAALVLAGIIFKRYTQ